jgi:hypothetical protein
VYNEDRRTMMRLRHAKTKKIVDFEPVDGVIQLTAGPWEAMEPLHVPNNVILKALREVGAEIVWGNPPVWTCSNHPPGLEVETPKGEKCGACGRGEE